MRQMKNLKTGEIINVKEHIIIQNRWEYYITDKKHGEDIVEALVMGFETEYGDVSMKEISPYIICRTRKLDELMPAPNWEWV